MLGEAPAADRIARFRSMGVEVAVAGAPADVVAEIEDLFRRWDDTFAPSGPLSELSRVNETAWRDVLVSPLFAEVAEVALSAARATGGLVGPTRGAALAGAGSGRAVPGQSARLSEIAVAGRDAEVTLAGRLLSRPPSVRLDLNGIVKSLAADRAAALLPGDGFVWAGSRLAARGAVTVALADGEPVTVHDGGIATSDSTVCAWRHRGHMDHRLVDPRTGRPARSRWKTVTVTAGSCVAADVAAKAASLLSDDGPEWLDERLLAGRFSDADGVVVENACWSHAVPCL
jgi:thiamine biosynthesis lipoprotein